MTYFSGVRMMAFINTNNEILKIANGCFQGYEMKYSSNFKKFIISGTRFFAFKIKITSEIYRFLTFGYNSQNKLQGHLMNHEKIVVVSNDDSKSLAI